MKYKRNNIIFINTSWIFFMVSMYGLMQLISLCVLYVTWIWGYCLIADNRIT